MPAGGAGSRRAEEMRATQTLILFTAAAAFAAFGQSADTPAPAFDVASVKVSQPGADGVPRGRGNTQVSPGTVTMRNVSLKAAIRPEERRVGKECRWRGS